MLLNLTISNFAIIKHLVFTPNEQLNIITGETGAGKSIVLDALSLILGSRADIKTQSEWGEKCVVEGVFLLDNKKYKPLFELLELDFEKETIIRREINTNGKSRTFINDTPVTLNQLKAIGSQLVSIHSQHENAHLSDSDFQFQILDNYAQLNPILKDYSNKFTQYKIIENKLEILITQQQNLLKEKDYLSFLAEEFEKLNLLPNEEELLESELQLLSNADNIEQVSDLIIQSVAESENAIVDILALIKTKLKTLVNISIDIRNIYQRIDSSIIELKDIVNDIENIRQNAQPNAIRLEEVNNRLLTIQSLKRKHGVDSFNDLLLEKDKLNEQLFSIDNIDHEVEKIKNELAIQDNELNILADNLHQIRVLNAPKLSFAVEQLLLKLEMTNAKIEFKLERKETFNVYGKSNLSILFSANLGMPLQSLNKVASGGELSRLALCFRSIEAEMGQLGTLIFDEIDTGVSGKVASTIGEMFKNLSKQHQVIAITHLPQVAGYGKAHFMLYKKDEALKTITYLKELSKEERVEELAAMLSGNKATENAKRNALELLKV